MKGSIQCWLIAAAFGCEDLKVNGKLVSNGGRDLPQQEEPLTAGKPLVWMVEDCLELGQEPLIVRGELPVPFPDGHSPVPVICPPRNTLY